MDCPGLVVRTPWDKDAPFVGGEGRGRREKAPRLQVSGGAVESALASSSPPAAAALAAALIPGGLLPLTLTDLQALQYKGCWCRRLLFYMLDT